MPFYRSVIPLSRNAFITREIGSLIRHASASVPDTATLYASDLLQPNLLLIPEHPESLYEMYGETIYGDLIAPMHGTATPTEIELRTTYGRAWSINLMPDKRGVLITEWSGGTIVPFPAAPSANVSWIFGKPLSDAEDSETRSTGILMLRWIYAALRFMTHKITTIRTLPEGDRPAMRRLARAGFEHAPAIEIIELRRRTAAHAPTGEHDPVDWSCRWGVDGHWRNQFYSSTGEHKLIWIDPYIKGPPDKPLKVKPTVVYGLVR